MLERISYMNGLFVIFVLLSACSAPPNSQIQTQAQGELVLKADQYAVQVIFMAQAKTSELALAKLNANLVDFLNWRQTTGFDVVTQNQSVQPTYQYIKNSPRKLTGYRAQHSFTVQGLSLNQYDNAMKKIATFNPESLNQGQVGVSEDMRKQAQQQAYERAFKANEAKLKTLMDLAKLCWPKVKELNEQSNSHAAPSTMLMKSKSAPVANEHTISVRLDIVWEASQC